MANPAIHLDGLGSTFDVLSRNEPNLGRVSMGIIKHKARAFVFTPWNPVYNGIEALLNKNYRKASRAASFQNHGLYSGLSLSFPLRLGGSDILKGFSSDFPKTGILSYSRAESRYASASGGPVVDSDGVVIAIHRGWSKHSSVEDPLSAGQFPDDASENAHAATFVSRAAQVTLVGLMKGPALTTREEKAINREGNA
ncbi:hypothetical protein FHL15_003545 [Xylaria flabelliformis]|uniref:Serine protease n=1 Tax=Xylaria flabelliformis TaxID=2512241 RepID=A0A553I5V5_9PEZI|nr:hypothetical protein FHL15_003545 [Xylaria flabelliformis]